MCPGRSLETVPRDLGHRSLMSLWDSQCSHGYRDIEMGGDTGNLGCVLCHHTESEFPRGPAGDEEG